MFVIEINDTEIVQRLQQIAERENRSIEAVLKTMIELYTARIEHEANIHTGNPTDVTNVDESRT